MRMVVMVVMAHDDGGHFGQGSCGESGEGHL